jgi:hypothetical protein
MRYKKCFLVQKQIVVNTRNERTKSNEGMANIMFSSCLSISDAIAAAGKLKSMLRLTEIEHELTTETSQESQEYILHSAASI